eukprot:TRINITY_DN40729_c0_g1_i1.p1 TRINITY_DN40729_c0_g1~~TRINITY_DN40729_c0_g1_i1.p1  ORF type:complete len:294 (+),score=67.28 TRINITY_DN40729_c0_g1_i1:113-994(+)
MSMSETANSCLSDEGLQRIQSLHIKLRKTTQTLAEAKQGLEFAESRVEEFVAISAAQGERHDACAKLLEQSIIERAEDQDENEELLKRLQAVEKELFAAESFQSGLIGPKEHSALGAELSNLQSEIEEAELENEDIRNEIASAQMANQRRERSVLAKAKLEEERHAAATEKAMKLRQLGDAISARAMVQENDRSLRQHQERLANLEMDRDAMLAEIQELGAQNALIEHRMQEMRNRIRSLEQQHSRDRKATESKELELKTQLRRQQHQIRVLGGLLQEDWADQPVSTMGSSYC